MHFLGLEIDHSHEVIFLHHQKNSKNLLKKLRMLMCKAISKPIKTNVKLHAQEGKDLKNATMYRQLVHNLIFLTLTQLDISFIVDVMRRCMC